MLNRNKFVQGGIHPKDTKFLSNGSPIEALKCLPSKLMLLLKQHPGQAATPNVEIGQQVKAGECIALANGRFSAPIHASLAGVVEAIVTIGPQPHIEIRPSDGEEAVCHQPVLAPHQLSREALVEIIRSAGLVGMGGAMFPVADKLSLSFSHDIDTLVINGGECEPYLTCDDRLMQEHSDRIIEGIRILLKVCNAKQAIVGIEKNKPLAIKVMQAASKADASIQIKPLPVLYPMGSEKQMIRALTGKQVPSGKLTSELGVIIQNVGSCEAVYKAVCEGKPLTHRVITVSGRAINRPANILAPIGTPISLLIEQCGGYKTQPEQIILGGPMMGRDITQSQTPIAKGSSGLLLLTEKEAKKQQPQSCIRCGRCAEACPMQLQPLNLFPLLQQDKIDAAKDAGVMDCLQCGACTYACPSSLPLTATFGWGKQQIGIKAQQQRKAESLHQAQNLRKLRLEKEATESISNDPALYENSQSAVSDEECR